MPLTAKQERFMSHKMPMRKIYTGPRTVNGRLHGSNWEPVYVIEVAFTTEVEADNFLLGLQKQEVASCP